MNRLSTRLDKLEAERTIFGLPETCMPPPGIDHRTDAERIVPFEWLA